MKKLLAVLVIACACAAGPHPAADAAGDEEMRLAVQELEARWAELRAVASAQDCRRTCELSELVCEAAGRICSIAARSPGRADFSRRCEDARSSCTDARATCDGCKQGAAGP